MSDIEPGDVAPNDPMGDIQTPQGLEPPPPILIMTLTVDVNGGSSLRYNMPPVEAVRILREVADATEQETLAAMAEAEQWRRAQEGAPE